MEKVFVTKYALSKGITENEVFEFLHGQNAHVREREGSSKVMFVSSRDWTRDKSEAISRAEELRIKKIQALNRQIKKLSAKKFD